MSTQTVTLDRISLLANIISDNNKIMASQGNALSEILEDLKTTSTRLNNVENIIETGINNIWKDKYNSWKPQFAYIKDMLDTECKIIPIKKIKQRLIRDMLLFPQKQICFDKEIMAIIGKTRNEIKNYAQEYCINMGTPKYNNITLHTALEIVPEYNKYATLMLLEYEKFLHIKHEAITHEMKQAATLHQNSCYPHLKIKELSEKDIIGWYKGRIQDVGSLCEVSEEEGKQILENSIYTMLNVSQRVNRYTSIDEDQKRINVINSFESIEEILILSYDKIVRSGQYGQYNHKSYIEKGVFVKDIVIKHILNLYI